MDLIPVFYGVFAFTAVVLVLVAVILVAKAVFVSSGEVAITIILTIAHLLGSHFPDEFIKLIGHFRSTQTAAKNHRGSEKKQCS